MRHVIALLTLASVIGCGHAEYRVTAETAPELMARCGMARYEKTMFELPAVDVAGGNRAYADACLKQEMGRAEAAYVASLQNTAQWYAAPGGDASAKDPLAERSQALYDECKKKGGNAPACTRYLTVECHDRKNPKACTLLDKPAKKKEGK